MLAPMSPTWWLAMRAWTGTMLPSSLHVQQVGEQQGGDGGGEQQGEQRPDAAGCGEHEQRRQGGGRDGDRQAAGPGGQAGEVGESEAEGQGGGPAPQGGEAAQGGGAESAAAGLDDGREGEQHEGDLREVAAAHDLDDGRVRQAGGRRGPGDVLTDEAQLEHVGAGAWRAGDPQGDGGAGARG